MQSIDIIKNTRKLNSYKSKIGKDIIKILGYILNEIKADSAIRKSVNLKDDILSISELKISLNEINNIYVVGGGKAALKMAEAINDIIGIKITRGVIVVKDSSECRLGKIKIVKGSHPIPDKEGLAGTKEILEISSNAHKGDLIISLISGGGSALITYPLPGIELSHLRKTTELLINSGADIREINTIRKHLSSIKGGRLSSSAYPAMIVSLIISDVVGDDISTIASGPTCWDDTTYMDAYLILKRYNLLDRIPGVVLNTIQKGIKKEIPETPCKGEQIFKNTHNIIILNNLYALKKGMEKATELGYNSIILSSLIEGEAREVGIIHAGIAKEILISSNPIKTPAIVLSGGETTVTLDNTEKNGGPNQECLLGFASSFKSMHNIVFISVDSDGIDGCSSYSGGIIGGTKRTFDREEILKHLHEHSSSEYLNKINAGILTGETGTNVNDIRITGVINHTHD